MIDTISTQAAHYEQGCWTSGTGDHVVMFVGSCRLLSFVNYFQRLNKDNRFTIALVYVVNFGQTYEQQETKPVLLDMIKRCRWFIKEHCVNYGMFNTSKDAEKSIYDFGMNPELDILIPSWNDHLVLENDWSAYGSPTPEDYVEKGKAEIEKFCGICELSSFPELAEYFRANWKTTRFFYRPNHTSAAFTLYLMRLMNEKMLHLDLTDEFWAEAGQEDLFRTPCTSVTQRDRDAYNITW